MTRRREFSEPAPGVVKVRLQGDTVGADVLAVILRDHPAVEVLTGPDRYDGGRQYLLVRVRTDGSLDANKSPEGTGNGSAGAIPEPRLLRAPCGDYRPAEPDGPCTTCDRSPAAHRMAAAAAGAPWPGDNDGDSL